MSVKRLIISLLAVIALCGCQEAKPKKDLPEEGLPENNLTLTSAGTTYISLGRKRADLRKIFIEYKLNDGEWTPYEWDSVFPLKNEDKVSFRACQGGNREFSKDDYFYCGFKITGPGHVAASGNVMSLIDRNPETLTIPCEFCFCKLFENCEKLTSAPELPATALTAHCYDSMFSGCSALTTAPALPATELAENCYANMFSGCTSLSTAPELPATTLTAHCYDRMFYRCSALTTAPTLPATELAENCYANMFSGCTSLITAPELPATTLEEYCYDGMFCDCTALTASPELPAIFLKPFCYHYMFAGCSKLNYVKAFFIDFGTFYLETLYWLSEVSPTGTFVKNIYAIWDDSGESFVPDGWKIRREHDPHDSGLSEAVWEQKKNDAKRKKCYTYDLNGLNDNPTKAEVFEKFGQPKHYTFIKAEPGDAAYETYESYEYEDCEITVTDGWISEFWTINPDIPVFTKEVEGGIRPGAKLDDVLKFSFLIEKDTQIEKYTEKTGGEWYAFYPSRYPDDCVCYILVKDSVVLGFGYWVNTV